MVIFIHVKGKSQYRKKPTTSPIMTGSIQRKSRLASIISVRKKEWRHNLHSEQLHHLLSIEKEYRSHLETVITKSITMHRPTLQYPSV